MGPFSGTSFADRPEQPRPQSGITVGVASTVVSTSGRTMRSGARGGEHPTRRRRVRHPAPAISTIQTLRKCVTMWQHFPT